jgi:hypothetical protein
MYWLAIVYSRRAAYAIIIPRLSLLRQDRARCRQCRSTHLHQRSTERILCIPSACFHLDRSTTAWRRLVIDSQTVTSQRRSSRPALLRNANAVLDTAHCHNSTQHLLEGTLLTGTRSSYRFNLTGLNTEVQYYQYALDLVTDVFDFDCDDDMREQIEKSARHLYGLVHARYIVTTRGLAKMV